MPGLTDTVLYVLTANDATVITDQRRRSQLAANQWPNLAGHTGSDVAAGDIYRADVVRILSIDPAAGINLQVHLDGSDLHWVERVTQGTAPGTWHWPDL